MDKITKERKFEYLLEFLKMIKGNGGRYHSRDIIGDLSKRLKLSPHELSTYDNGSPKWETAFRFHSIGLVKAGIIIKEKGLWKLTETDLDIDKLTVESLGVICDGAYIKWKEERDRQAAETGINPFVVEDEYELPESNLKIDPRKVSFDDLLKGVDKSLIQIPPFQREFVWTPSKIRFLLDSIHRGYPIGSFIFWKTSRRLPHHREIGGLKLNDIAPNTLIDYVLDGQQRITSLYAAVRGANIQGDKYKFFFNLRTGKFQSEQVKEGEETEENTDLTKVPLETLFVESRAAYMRHASKYPEHQQDILNDLYDRFKLYAFSVIYVQEEEEPEEDGQVESVKRIVNIFSRINETGQKLSVVAKMVARCWGEGFDIREKLDEFYRQNKELEEIREETLLQTISVILNQRRSKSIEILNITDIRILEREWDNIMEAFKSAIDFVRNKIKIKNLKYLPFDSTLVPLAYFHYKNHNPSNGQSEQLKEWFWKACLSNRFGSSVEGKMEDDCKNFDLILDGGKPEFQYQIDWESLKTRLIAQNYYLRNAFCKTVLSLYSYLEPKSFKDGRDVNIDKAFSGYYKHNLHHFFPKKYLEKVFDPLRERRDSVVNIAFAPAIVNIEMSDDAPSEYIKEFEKDNLDFDKILSSHFIDNRKKFGLEDNNFSIFLEKRAEKIENEFRILLGLKSKTEQQFEKEPSTPIDLTEIKIRDLINTKLQEEYGTALWEEAVPSDIRYVVEQRIESQIKAHPYEFEQYKSPDGKLSFLDIMDYSKIILSNWNIFAGIFSSKSELEKHFLALKNYRNGVKHSRDMNPVIQKNGEAAVLWFESVLVENL